MNLVFTAILCSIIRLYLIPIMAPAAPASDSSATKKFDFETCHILLHLLITSAIKLFSKIIRCCAKYHNFKQFSNFFTQQHIP